MLRLYCGICFQHNIVESRWPIVIDLNNKRVAYPRTKLLCDDCYNSLKSCHHKNRLILRKPQGLFKYEDIFVCCDCLGTSLIPKQINKLLLS